MARYTNKRKMRKSRSRRNHRRRSTRKMRGGMFGINTSALKKQASKTVGKNIHSSVKSHIGKLQNKVGSAVQTGALSQKGQQHAMNIAKHAAIASSATSNMHNQMKQLTQHVSSKMSKGVPPATAEKLKQVHTAAKKVTQQVKQQPK